MTRFLATCAGAVALIWCSACVEPTAPEPETPTLTTITVAAPATAITVGQTTQATASGVDQFDAPIATGSVTWTSTPNASVSTDGVITAVASGSATVTASAGGTSGQLTLTINALPATGLSLRVAPNTTLANRSVFASQPVVRLVNSANGFAAQAGVVVTVATSDGALVGATTATTDANGIAAFAGLGLSGKTGARTLTFSAPSLSPTTANVTLTAGVAANIAVNSGNQQTVATGASVPVAPSVIVTDADANPVNNTQVEFTITAGSGSVAGATPSTNANGIATLGSWTLGTPGLNTLQAKVVGQSVATAFSAMATQAPALASITVTLASSTIQAGQTTQASATGIDQYGANIATGAITWSSSTAVASVTSTGLVTGNAGGQATINAAANGKNGQAIVTVLATPVLTTLSVSVAQTSIQVGQTTQATVTAFDQFGAAMLGVPVTWSASGGVTINASGVVTGVSAGASQITATAGGKSAQATLSVSAAPTIPVLASLELSISPSSIQIGANAQATLVGRDQFGGTIATGPVTWLSTNNATVSTSGGITGISAGTATITANAGGKSAQATINVSAAPTVPVLTSLELSINPSSIQIGANAQATLVGRDQFGGTIATGPVAWLSTNNATVSASGGITGTSVGTATITANAGGFSAQGTITVTSPTSTSVLTSMSMSLNPSAIQVGQTTQPIVRGRDQFGAPMATGPLTWTVNNGNATVSSTGLVTGVSGGTTQVTATSGSVSIYGDIIIIPPPPTVPTLTSIVVTLSPSTIISGETSQATAQGLDQYGAPIATGPITWSLPSSVTPRMTISASGFITSQLQFGGRPIPVTATAGSVSGSAGLTVRVATKITVTFAKSQILIGETNDATIAAFDDVGDPINVPLSVNQYCPAANCGGSGSIVRNSNTSATVTATKIGQFTLQIATPTGPGGTNYYGYASFNIDEPPYLANIIATFPASLAVGQVAHIDLKGIDHHGAPFPIPPGLLLYETHPPAVASVTQTGDITPMHPTLVVVKVSGTLPRYNIPWYAITTYTVTGTPTARLVVTSAPSVIKSRVPVTTPIVVQIVDAQGVPINWVSNGITATLTSGGGTLSGETMVGTGPQGFGQFNDLAISGSAGPKTITFTGLGVNPLDWSFTLSASAPVNIAINAGANQTGPTGAALPVKPAVKVTDVDGNAVSGVAVTFTVTGGGGTVTGASATTDANGIATVGSWTLGSVGANTLRAQAAGAGAVTFNATGTP